MPGWVKAMLNGFTPPTLTPENFFVASKNGTAWGDGLTEKAVWHVVRKYAAKAGIERLAPHDLGHVPAFVTRQVENWNKFSSCLRTSQFKRPRDTSDASSAFDPP